MTAETATRDNRAFIGRGRELEVLATALRQARVGHGQTVLLAGEPGIGKTQLLTTWVEHAAGAGARVYWGRCREEGGAPVHWPWVQILRALARDMPPEVLAEALGSGAPYVVTAVPELGEHLPAAARVAPGSTSPDRFTFFDAVQTFLRRLATMPLVLIFDDLHAADPSSLALLDFVSTDLDDTQLLLMGTYRTYEAATSEAGPALTRIARHGQRLQLSGLDVEEVGALLSRVAGHAVAARQVAPIHAATEGNPLFVHEIARTLAARGQLGGDDALIRVELPDTVEHVLANRLTPLSAAAREVLSTAAVMGRAFDVVTLEQATTVPAATILSYLQEAVDAGIVSVSGGVRAEAAFAHAVYREFFYGALPLQQRATAHYTLATVLERHEAAARLSDIAFHLLAAGPVGDPSKAVAYALRAGDQALAGLAYAQAARHYADALRALDTCPRDDGRRCDLLLRLGDARFRAGESDAGKQVLRQAAELARTINDGERLGRAALALAGPWVLAGGGVRDDVVVLLEHALAALPPASETLRVLVLSRLAIEIQFVDLTERPLHLAQEAVAIARRLDHPATLAEALLGQHAAVMCRNPASQSQALALSRETVTLTRSIANPELHFRARFNLIFDLLQSGDAGGLDDQLGIVTRLAEQMHQPLYDWFIAVWRAMRAMIDGRLDTAEELVEAANRLGTGVLGADELTLLALQVYRAQLFAVRRERGRALEELLPFHRSVADVAPVPYARVMIPLLYCDLEQWRDARDAFEQLAAADFSDIRHDLLWTLSHAWLAEVCAALGDQARARLLYDLLLPYAAEQFTNGNIYCGSISFYLGLLAATLNEVSDAVTHFTTAQRHHRRMGARCWITRTQLHHGALLFRQTGARERRRGRSLLEEALDRARQLGMNGVVAQAERVLAQDGKARPVAPVPAVAAPARNILRRRGDYWTVTFGGDPFQIKDQRGLAYLQQLLTRPGHEVHVIELLSAADGGVDGGSAARAVDHQLDTARDLGDAGTVLDAEATAQYQRRLAELREELAEAEADNDLGRAAHLREELAFLAEQLASAGRGRRIASHAERARVTVAKGITAAVKKIAAAHPELGRHLEATLRTGYFCSYKPDPRIEWLGGAAALVLHRMVTP